ncbi:immunity protein Imm33 domain-containing protein [Acinetobacter baumannii]|uniref:immunity protein Imm33 domain-containing protein n=1 Tax=Acinetobacter baumannii TaxID=470 RepID=UPI003D022383
MSGWWLTADKYDGDIETLKNVHFTLILEKRPDLAIYMALPYGYRFILGGEEEHVWFDENALDE